MQKLCLLIALMALTLACGCDKENKTRIQNIDAVTQKLIAQQQEQARQLAEVRAQLSTLPVQMDKTQFDYFLKGQEKALFYQTNLLFLLLTVDKNIQSQFQLAAEAREAASRQTYLFHTNEMDVTVNCLSQLIAAVAGQETNIIETVNSEVQRSQANLSRDLAKQLQQLAADKSEAARLKAIEADLKQIQRDLAGLKSQLAGTNPAPQLPGTPGRR
jgi:hypothetical protein